MARKLLITVLAVILAVEAWLTWRNLGPRRDEPGTEAASPSGEGGESGDLQARPSVDCGFKVLAERFDAVLDGLKRRDMERAMEDAMAFASQWDVFGWRFGRNAEDMPGWPSIVVKAKLVLGRLRPRSADEAYYNVASNGALCAVLLEVVGETDAALSELDQFDAGGFCGNWQATIDLVKATRRSAIRERKGDFVGALAAAEGAIENLLLALHSKNEDILRVRHARLLGVTSGNSALSWFEYQMVLDLFPRTVGAELARLELRAAGQLVEPTARRVADVYFAGEYRAQAIAAMGVHRFPESCSILRSWLIDNGAQQRCVIEALGVAGDAAAVPDLVRVARDGDEASRIAAIVALARLGDRSQVAGYVAWLRYHNRRSIVSGFMADKALREIHGGQGPEMPNGRYSDAGDVGECWARWLAERDRAIRREGK